MVTQAKKKQMFKLKLQHTQINEIHFIFGNSNEKFNMHIELEWHQC